MKNVLITGGFKFPDQDAAGIRVHSIAELFNADYKVNIAGWENDYLGQKEYTYNTFHCYAQGDLDYSTLNPFFRLIASVFRGYRTFIWLFRQPRFDIIILYNPPAIFSLCVLLITTFFKGKVILDSTEWYDSGHLSKNLLGFARLENSLRMKFAYRFFRNTICISEYLDKYYKKKNSIIIPPIFGNKLYSDSKDDKILDDELLFFYAGQMGQKDKLSDFIFALPQIAKTLGIKVKLIIAGIDYQQLIKSIDNNDRMALCRPFIECLGKIQRYEVTAYYQKVHFVVFFREDKRYAIAGFPSKSIEAWSYGIPLVTNAVGELKKYLIDGQNSILINDFGEQIDSFILKLNSIIINGQYNFLVKGSLDTFKSNFELNNFKESFNKFIQKLK